jgi:hypothetical protein
MKRILLTILVFQSYLLVAQTNDVNQIKADFKSFNHAMQTLDFEHFLDMTYPPVFEIYDREVFKEAIKEALEGNEEIRVEIVEMDESDYIISEVFDMNSPTTKYAFISYPTRMKMTFAEQTFDAEMQEMMALMMETDIMKINFINSNTLLMDQKTLMIAINDSKTNRQWKYLNYDSEMEMSDLIPEKVIEDAIAFFQAYLNEN